MSRSTIETVVLNRWDIDLGTFATILHKHGIEACFMDGMPKGPRLQVEQAVRSLTEARQEVLKESA